MKTFTEEESQVFIDEGRADQILRFGRNNDFTIPVINVWDTMGCVYHIAPLDCVPETEEVEAGGIVEEMDNEILYYSDVFNKDQDMLDELQEHCNFTVTLEEPKESVKLIPKQKYYSIRVVNALDKDSAIEEIEKGNFDETDLLCDSVLTKDELFTTKNTIRDKIIEALSDYADGDFLVNDEMIDFINEISL